MAATFHAWSVSPLRGLAVDQAVGGRLQATASLTIRDYWRNDLKRSGGGAFELLGPGDVVRLVPGAISRRFPAPGAHDAEETKAALVEFSSPDLLDLPWRYTPETDRPTAGGGRGLRPWLVLVVGTAGRLRTSPDGLATLSPEVQAKHPLADSWRWAHVHQVDGRRVARILCPADLEQDAAYVAALVPAFVVEEDGTTRAAWPPPGGGDAVLPCYDSWTFATGPEGDFPQLAARLHAASLAELGADFGRAAIRYDRRGDGVPATAMLAMAGALQLPPDEAPPPQPLEPWITAEVAALSKPLPTPDGSWVLTLPRYDAPFVPPGPAAGTGWAAALAADPRARGAAGLGAAAGIAWQDRIAAAAATKAGDLAIARERVGQVALGLEASRSLWRRRLPADPVGRLAVLGPMLRRMPLKGGGTVLDAVAHRLPRALWSSAARRALRPGPARVGLAAAGAGRFATILAVAATCPPPARDGDVIPVGRDVDPDQRLAAAKDAIIAAGRRDAELTAFVLDSLLGRGNPPDEAQLAAVLVALDPGGGRPADPDAVRRAVENVERPPLDGGDLIDLIDRLGARGGPPPCRSIDIVGLGKRISDAADPTVDRPVIVDRVLGTLKGVKGIGPVELQPELDLPLWRYLADAAPDWLLPGVGGLAEHAVVAVATNPAFVEAMLAGANCQALAELRWRNMPIISRWSPLRKFWHRPAGAFDITPIAGWPQASPLGGPGVQSPGTGVEAVVVFRTPLFRRYPGTAVYLYADSDWLPPPPNVPLAAAQKIAPSFAGTVGDDIVFFGFPVAPAALATHWVVLEEPPSGYRFYTEDRAGAVIGAVGATAADYASKTFAVPVRVMIGRLLGGGP